MACLKNEGIDENTIILFTTDDGVQGAAISRTPDYWNMGMRGKKGSKEKIQERLTDFLKHDDRQVRMAAREVFRKRLNLSYDIG